MTKVHRIVLCVVDHDQLGTDEVRSVLESTHYPNHCISPRVVEVATRQVDWTDEHPLNQDATATDALNELFAARVTRRQRDIKIARLKKLALEAVAVGQRRVGGIGAAERLAEIAAELEAL